MAADATLRFGPTWASRLFFGGLLAFFLLFDAVLLIGTVLEQDPGLLAAGLILGPLTLLAAFLAARNESCLLLHPDRLEVRRAVVLRQTIPYAEIVGVSLPERLCITTRSGGTVRVGFSFRDQAVPVLEALRARVPGLRAASALPDTLPLVFWRRSSARWTDVALGPGLGAFVCFAGLVGTSEGVKALLAGDWGQAALNVLLSGMFWLLGLGLIWFGLFRSVWRYVFQPDRIEARALLWRRTFAVSELEKLELRSEKRTMKGGERTAWVLALAFRGGRELKVEPTEGGFPGSFSPEADRRDLYALSVALRSAYAERGL